MLLCSMRLKSAMSLVLMAAARQPSKLDLLARANTQTQSADDRTNASCRHNFALLPADSCSKLALGDLSRSHSMGMSSCRPAICSRILRSCSRCSRHWVCIMPGEIDAATGIALCFMQSTKLEPVSEARGSGTSSNVPIGMQLSIETANLRRA